MGRAEQDGKLPGSMPEHLDFLSEIGGKAISGERGPEEGVHISKEERFDVRGKNNGLEEAMAIQEKTVPPLGLQRTGVGN